MFEHLHLLWMGIWLHNHTVTTTESQAVGSVQIMELCYGWGCRIFQIASHIQVCPLLPMVPTNKANWPLAIPPNCLRAINVLTDFLAADWFSSCVVVHRLLEREYPSVMTSHPSNLTWVSFQQVRPKAFWATSKCSVAIKPFFYFISTVDHGA